ncbi:winged helix-turn-helix transcriptional regulator [Nocardiopsis kunsanensis]|uniref:HxlR family transcriptional regulator n=1 Tax=Nocardiopsis kunsanensis TaxID=141693 RepID=A0A918XFU3_9ACTN|nr:helix-turn-helix domain-containing protein [Nocardiopsis kunsanensis]GHD28835.1 HxlR family transcriptional regulator [Nocardiopsis kunsanensis]
MTEPDRRPLPASPQVPGRPCPAAAALQVVGEKWALLVVRELLFGVGRFTDIARNTGAPRDRLTARLRTLEQAGVVERHSGAGHSGRQEYRLTEAGQELAPVLFSLVQWGNTWLFEQPLAHLHHHTDQDTASEGHRHELTLATTCTTCGEAIRSGEITAVPPRSGPPQRG